MMSRSTLFDIEAALAGLAVNVLVVDLRDRCRRRSLVQVLDELLDLVLAALGFSRYLQLLVSKQQLLTPKLTEPSEALVTKPVTPMLLACFWVKDRKLTPWTSPSTLYEIWRVLVAVVVHVKAYAPACSTSWLHLRRTASCASG
jgi:hypothetical protein